MIHWVQKVQWKIKIYKSVKGKRKSWEKQQSSPPWKQWPSHILAALCRPSAAYQSDRALKRSSAPFLICPFLIFWHTSVENHWRFSHDDFHGWFMMSLRSLRREFNCSQQMTSALPTVKNIFILHWFVCNFFFFFCATNPLGNRKLTTSFVIWAAISHRLKKNYN